MGETQAFSTIFFSFFFYRHRTAFCPTVLFFFNLREKRVLVLITWLQFTWDRKKRRRRRKQREQRKEGNRGNERGNTEIHSWLGFPYHSQHSWIMKKSGDFWTGGRCVAWRGYKGSLLRGTALVVVSVRPVTSPRRLSFLLTSTVWFETRALSQLEALMQLWNPHEMQHKLHELWNWR